MRLQRATHYLLTHLTIATTIAFVCSFLPFLSLFAALFAALVTLRLGILRGAIVTVLVTVPTTLFQYYFAYTHQVESLDLLALEIGLVMVFVSNFLTWELAVLTTRRVSMSKLLQLGALFGVFCVSVVHLVYPDVVNWWGTQLQALSIKSIALTTDAASNAVPGLSASQLKDIAFAKYYATGSLMTVILINAFVQLIIAKMWSRAVFDAPIPSRELHHVRLSYAAGIVFIISSFLAYFGNNSVVLDMMPIMYILFCAAGLSVVHYLFSLIISNTRIFWMCLFYLVLIFLIPNGSLHLLAMVGLLDVWFDIRKRLTKV